ncbi:MAG TPA: type II secretion system protein GspC [Thioalkalivibrio sp.]|nr:type II secretion system protein GspC [Thioalkalivibrio sp.]
MNTAFFNNWQRHEPWFFRLALIVLLVLLGQAMARLAWQLFTPSPSVAVAAPSTPTAAATPARTQNPASALAMRHLFGTTEVIVDTAAEAPETKLDLKLVGVFATGDSSALAIIAPGRRPEALYGIGDSLPGNATLRAVYADRVVLERNGVLETLRLPRESLGAGVSIGTPSSATTGIATELQRYRREAMRNPARMAEMVAAEPVEEDGRFVGYRVTPRQDLPVFEQLGFQAGDVVTEVNGVALDTPEAGIRALRQLATARELNVTVLRNGTPQTIQAEFGR